MVHVEKLGGSSDCGVRPGQETVIRNVLALATRWPSCDRLRQVVDLPAPAQVLEGVTVVVSPCSR